MPLKFMSRFWTSASPPLRTFYSKKSVVKKNVTAYNPLIRPFIVTCGHSGCQLTQGKIVCLLLWHQQTFVILVNPFVGIPRRSVAELVWKFCCTGEPFSPTKQSHNPFLKERNSPNWLLTSWLLDTGFFSSIQNCLYLFYIKHKEPSDTSDRKLDMKRFQSIIIFLLDST